MDKYTPSYNLNVVVRETGIKPDTLRAWERRYGLPDPKRTEGGHRLYSSHDIEMIRWLMSRQGEGMRISQAVRLWRDHEADGTDPLTPIKSSDALTPISADLPDDSVFANLRQTWVESCLNFNEGQADQVFSQALARFSVETACIEVLQKGLRLIGDRWYTSEITVQQEHFASELAIKRLNALIAAAPGPTIPGRILVGCPPGEEHTFSSLLVSLFLRYHGFDVTYLGANVPLENLEKTIQSIKPDLVVFTAMHLDAAARLVETAKVLESQNIRQGFGGRIFSVLPELQKVIPGYFLGDRLDRVVEVISNVLAGQILPNPPFQPADEYLQVLKAFDRIRLILEMNIYRHYSGSDFPADYLEMINHQFNHYLRAALVLGDLDYLETEISWSEDLIANNMFPVELIADYLGVYQRQLAEIGGKDIQLIVSWLNGRSTK